MSDWHVRPIDDLKEHDMGRACWCRPTIEDYEAVGHALVIHNSLDAREHFEPDFVNKETIQ